MSYLVGSRNVSGNGTKKIAAFIGHSSDGSEVYICSNLIESGFRMGQPENSDGKWFTLDEAGHVIHKNQQKLLTLYTEFYYNNLNNNNDLK